MNPTTPTPPAEPLLLRILRVVARVGLALIITFFAGLALLASSSHAREAFNALLGFGDNDLARSKLLVLVGIVPLFVGGLFIWLGRRLSWRALGLRYAAVAMILIYLAWDDPTLQRPQTMEEFSPVFPGAEESYAVLMRYGNHHPAGRDFSGSRMGWIGFDPQKPELWQKFMTEHRAEIEKEWQDLAPVRAWWTELNRFERIGDLTPPQPDAELLAFSPCRMLSQRACGIATLQALDGRGDEAIETLLPVLEVARKLQPSSRTLVRTMIAIVVEKLVMRTAGFVLDHASVSPAARARLAAVLAAPGGGEAGARRLPAIEFVYVQSTYIHLPLGDMPHQPGSPFEKLMPYRPLLNVISPLVFNRRTTFNLYADYTTGAEENFARRQVDELKSWGDDFLAGKARPRFKNVGGTMMLKNLTTLYAKIAQAYWEDQDVRAALLARVTAP